MSFRIRVRARELALFGLTPGKPTARRLAWLLATTSVVACSFPERSFIPADEFERMKDAGGTGGSANGGSANGGSGGNAGNSSGGDAGSGAGAGGAGGATGGAAGSAGAAGATSGGAAGSTGGGGTGATGGSAGTGGSGATGGAGAMGGTAGVGASGGSAGTGGTAGNSTGGTGGGATQSVIFSEYVEGTSFNKALEIFNGSSATLSLSTCVLNKYINAGTTATPLALDSVDLLPNKTWVICNNMMSDTSKCDRVDAFISHNGNEAYSLVCGGVVLDSFGQTGAGTVTRWGSGSTSTEDHTLRRKCSVTQGDVDLSDAFDPATEWDGFTVDDFTGLGKHCGSG